MGSLTSAFGTDAKKEQDGIWLDILTNDDGSTAKMRVRRMGPTNKKFAKRFAALSKKVRMLRGSKQELEVAALREAFIETCLIDWANIENINEVAPGQTKETYMPFTKDNALKLFESLPDLLDFVVGQATELENFQNEQTEVEAKNSFPS